ncbi:biopolymer transporter TolR [Maribellus luteus]|uniref:Biopolymer transporter TolR n=1 Tax=Maribellus luteus TaxID=2305463 RepID=A0A399SWB4_9BACT|nr:TolB family protein [Maribellus luteus]RIJ47758.1 biopolymer transporter TolR [Maribellus luteus]
MKKLYTFLLTMSLLTFSPDSNSQGMFERFSGISLGDPKLTGSTDFDVQSQVFTLKGAGANMWFDRDECWFECTKIKGDFILSANVEFVGEGVNAHRKMGIMARSGSGAGSAYADACVHGDGLTGMQFREKDGENTQEVKSDVSAPGFIQLERKGNSYIVRISKDRQALITVAQKELELGEEVLAGLFICSHDEDVIETARFSNVRLEIPAAAGVDGYRTPSPSRLEVLDVETGQRTIVYETDAHIEAPNWSRDGKFLVYNSGGKLFRFDLDKKTPVEINTGFAQSNNNDHGISFDGKTLAISNHVQENGNSHSIIFTVPLEGGIPKRITAKGPSYWHGWSPDGKWLTYCAERNGNYDVYKIPSEGGEEIRLTNAEGLDDGPEYSPDGKFIYFNSVRTGMMQIWRMKPDGTDQEQVTFDDFQNWFAHPSPDGKQLIMISYLKEVPAGSHPHNQRVMLRVMPASGGEIKSMAFLYGGQGTLNVPSWSPDSKKVAFVSYTY